nr:cleavage stimulation factor subunit 50 [Ipomoea batatas]
MSCGCNLLVKVSKVKQMLRSDSRDSSVGPVIRTFYDHTQVRYSRNGGMFVTASKDGAIRLWDGVTANCVRSIDGAHGTEEATNSSVKLWEVGTGKLVKQYLGAVHTKLQFQAVFNDTEEFVLSIDESSNEIVVWDALTTKNVGRLPSNHIDVPRWIEHSPTEAAFVSCGIDQSVQFWREKVV